MTLHEALALLEAAGTLQNRKVYPRHGAREPMFGVSFANLRAIAKTIKTDHALAVALWETGNFDARLLAAMIANPAKATSAELDRWARDLDNYVVADAFAAFAAKSPHAAVKLDAWTAKPDREWIASAGWTLLAIAATSDPALPDSHFEPWIARIEREIHAAPNRVRHTMNSALIAIGLRGPALENQVLAAARRIGPVKVDHGQTGCKTPDAAAYIAKARPRAAARMKRMKKSR